MRRTCSTVVVFVTGLMLALVAAPQPAAAGAAGTATVEVLKDVLYPDCDFYTYIVHPDLPAEAEGWDMTVTVTDPDGEVQSEEYLITSSDAHDEYWDSFWLCSEDTRPGTFVMRGVGTWWDADYNDSPLTMEHTFRLRLPTSVSALSVRKANVAPRTYVNFTALVVEETPAGFQPAQFVRVVLQRKTRTGWAKVKGATALTNDKGSASLRMFYRRGRVVVRAKASPPEVTPSVSNKIVLR